MLKENVRDLERAVRGDNGGNHEYLKNVIMQYLGSNDFEVRGC